MSHGKGDFLGVQDYCKVALLRFWLLYLYCHAMYFYYTRFVRHDVVDFLIVKDIVVGVIRFIFVQETYQVFEWNHVETPSVHILKVLEHSIISVVFDVIAFVLLSCSVASLEERLQLRDLFFHPASWHATR